MHKRNMRIVSICTMILFLLTMTMPTFAAFSDVSNHWASATIEKWESSGILKGNTDGTFRPDNPIKRSEFVAVINRIFGYIEKGKLTFSDVSENVWYADDVAKAAAAGIVEGRGDGKFSPDAPISRQEAAVIMCRAFEINANDKNIADKFVDAKDIGAWSKDAVSALYEKEYISGRPGNKFAPKENLTRAECIKIINNLAGNLKHEAGTYSGGVVENLVVNTGSITLKDMTITGNLYLAQGIGKGEVILDNVIVKGRTVIRGGGENSIIIINSSLNNIVVYKVDGKIRILAKGSTEISDVQLKSGAKLEEEDLTGAGFGDIEIIEAKEGEQIILDGDFDSVVVGAPGINIDVSGGTVGELVVGENGAGASINIDATGSVGEFTADGSVTVTGKGSIDIANINVAGVVIEQKPKTTEVGEGITATVAGKELTEGVTTTQTPTYTGSINIKVSAISVTASAVTIDTHDGELQMTAEVSPTNARNKNVTWTVENGTGTATISETGLLKAVTNGTVTVRATAKDGSNKSGTLVITISNQNDRVIATAAIAGVTVPVKGATPVNIIAATAEYTATISWSPADGTFAADTVYTATITIAPKAGYKLAGVAEDFFTVAGATATNAEDSGVVTAVFPKTEAKLASTIGFAEAGPIAKLTTDAEFTNAATGAGDGAVTYSSGDEAVATVNENTGEVTIVGAGTAVITASQAESATHLAGTATYTLNVTTALEASTLAFAEAGPIAKLTTDAEFTNAATGAGDGAVTYSSGDEAVATVNENTGEVTIVGAGTAVITASQAESATHLAGTATYTLNVTTALEASTLAFAEAGPIAKTTADAAFTNLATGAGDGAVTYSSGDEAVATVNENTGEVTIVGAGSAVITASQAESDTHLAGTATYTLNVKVPATLAHDVAGNAKTFTPVVEGYGAGTQEEALTVTVVATGAHTNVAAVLADATNFDITAVGSATLADKDTTTFTVRTKDGLAAGTYTTTVTITSTEFSAGVAFTITQVVNAPLSNVATVTSGTYTVSAGGTATETITNVPSGTAKADFLAALTKGQADQTWDQAGLKDPVVSGNTLVVTAQDGVTTVTYTVTVNAPLSDVATVTSGTYTVSAEGTATETITNVPSGTAKADFLAALTKGQDDQTWSDTGIDDPVVSGNTLVVTAQDGVTTVTYTVTVNAPLSDVATVTSGTYTVSAEGTATETITNVPSGTAKADFLAALTKGQDDQTWSDTGIDDPVVSGNTLVVTAQDGVTTVTYTVTVNAPLSDVATVTSGTYTVSAEGTATETITNVPSGTAKADFLAALTKGQDDQTWDDTGIDDPVESNDTLVVTAQDGVTKVTYTITVNAPLSSAKDITAFSFTEQTGAATIGDGTIAIEVANGTDVTGLVATFTLSAEASAAIGGTPQVSGTTANNFTNPVTYVVTAEDNSTKDWVVTVTVAPAPTYALTLTGTGITSVPAAGNLTEGTSITVTVAPEAGKQVLTFTVGGEDKKADLAGTPLQYTFTMPAAATEVAVTYEDIPTDVAATNSIADATPTNIDVALDVAFTGLVKADFAVTKGGVAYEDFTVTETDAQNYILVMDDAAVDTDVFTVTITKDGYAFTGTAVTNNVAAPDEYFVFSAETGTITELTDIGKKHFGTNLVIPDSINGAVVKAIGNNAFANYGCTSLVLPINLETIGSGAFKYNKFTTVIIPNSVTSIGSFAFLNNELTKVTIPDSVTTIGEGAFENNKLTEVTIPGSVKYLGANEFLENGPEKNTTNTPTEPGTWKVVGKEWVKENNAPTVASGQGTQSGEAIPAAAGGTPAVVSYTADMTSWFEDVDVSDTLTYSVVSAVDEDLNDVSANVNVLSGSITYTPVAAQASKTVTIVVKANDGTADSTGNVTITVTVAAVPADADTTAPTITAGAVERTSDTEATVKFTSNEVGTYYIEVVEKDAAAPTINTSGAGTACTTDEVTANVTLTVGAKDVYVVVKDASGNVSEAMKLAIAAYVAPDSTITPTTADFDKKTGAQADVVVTMTLNGNTLTAVKNGGTALNVETDYTVSGNVVTIKKEYLATQAVGSVVLTFDFSAGADPTLTVTVSDTTPATYTVTFAAGTTDNDLADITGATNYVATETATEGVSYTAPVLSQSGYTFDGWFTDAACTVAYVAAVDAITADITLYAKFTADVPDTYTVTLEAGTSNNDLADITGATNYVATETATEGVSYTAPVLSQSGYTFDGWFTDAACTVAYVAAVDAITADITLYAKFTADVPDTYTVTLEAGTSNNDLADITGATNYVATETATEGVSYTAPVLSQSGYTFDGWFTDAACTVAYVAAVDAITADITLYAKFTADVPDTYTVTLEAGTSNNDLADITGATNYVATETATEGVSYTAPVLSQSGYTFDGWFTDAACTVAYVAAVDAITADITLYAKFTADVPDTYTVTLEAGTSNNDLADITGATNYVATETATEGVSYTAPVLSQSGYTFDGWFTDAACTVAYVAAVDAITADITLYAKWTAAVLNIDIGGTNYDLNDTASLPSGLSWDNDYQVLTMNGYEGTYIHKASEVNALNDLTIEVSGDNNVLQSNQQSGTILGFDNLTIQGTGKLLVKQTQYNIGINVFNKVVTVKGSVELTVEVAHKYLSNITSGIHGNATLEDTAKLVVAVNKTVDETKDAYGISGKLTLNGTGAVTITVTNTGTGEKKAVSGDVEGGNKDNYIFVTGEELGTSWADPKIKATYN